MLCWTKCRFWFTKGIMCIFIVFWLNGFLTRMSNTNWIFLWYKRKLICCITKHHNIDKPFEKSTSRDCGLWQHLPRHLLTQHISQMISYASQQCWIPSVVDCIVSFSENPSSAPCPCFSPSHTHLHLQGHPQSTCTEALLCPRTLLWYDILLVISKRHSFKVKVVLKHFSDLVQN